ncbi:MAG: alpha/beta hydrolase [Chloroflexi bacterium]|nr:alpha/beta hydrolase [Chloroflexota bacterium]
MPEETLTQNDFLEMAAQVAGIEIPELVSPEDHFLHSGELRLHYLDWGGSGKDTIVFLHGAHLTAHTWDLVCLALRPDYRCVALDARGHGDSDWAPDYSLDLHVGDVTALVRELGLDRFILVGHSMGGGTAVGYAGGNVEKLQALVCVDTGPRYVDPGQRDGHRRMQAFVEGPLEMDSVEEFVERAVEFNPARDRRLLRRSLLHNLRQTPQGKWAWKYDRDGLRQRNGGQDERQARLRDAVVRITCPTLVVRGGRSDIFSDEDAEQFVTHLPHGRWQRIENSGHTVQGDNPRGLVEAMRPFLSEVAHG